MIERRSDGLKEHCFCGVHVHTATKILMWLNIIPGAFYVFLVFIMMLFFLALPNELDNKKDPVVFITLTAKQIVVIECGVMLIFGTINIIICGLVLIGLKEKRSGFYWPYLIVVMIGIGFAVLYILATLIISFGLLFITIPHLDVYTSGLMAGVIFLVDFIIVLNLIPSIYFHYIIVNRSRKLLEAEWYYPVPSAPNQYA